MTFKTLGATALIRPQTTCKVLKLGILIHEGMHMKAFLRDTTYKDSLGKRYIYTFLIKTLYRYLLGFPYKILYGKSLLFRGNPWELPGTFGRTGVISYDSPGSSRFLRARRRPRRTVRKAN